MNRLLFPCLVACVIAVALAAFAAETGRGDSKLRHVVAFKFKDDAGKEKIDTVVNAFRDLKKKITQIQDFEWGTNVSPEKLDKGFTHQFILTFESDADRDAYLVHPDHKEFGKIVGPVLADVFVIDFWTKK